jgi:hypothetical protein
MICYRRQGISAADLKQVYRSKLRGFLTRVDLTLKLEIDHV